MEQRSRNGDAARPPESAAHRSSAEGYRPAIEDYLERVCGPAAAGRLTEHVIAELASAPGPGMESGVDRAVDVRRIARRTALGWLRRDARRVGRRITGWRCHIVPGLLQDRSDGRIEITDGRLYDHLNSCPRCAALADLYASAEWTLRAELNGTPPPPDSDAPPGRRDTHGQARHPLPPESEDEDTRESDIIRLPDEDAGDADPRREAMAVEPGSRPLVAGPTPPPDAEIRPPPADQGPGPATEPITARAVSPASEPTAEATVVRAALEARHVQEAGQARAEQARALAEEAAAAQPAQAAELARPAAGGRVALDSTLTREAAAAGVELEVVLAADADQTRADFTAELTQAAELAGTAVKAELTRTAEQARMAQTRQLAETADLSRAALAAELAEAAKAAVRAQGAQLAELAARTRADQAAELAAEAEAAETALAAELATAADWARAAQKAELARIAALADAALEAELAYEAACAKFAMETSLANLAEGALGELAAELAEAAQRSRVGPAREYARLSAADVDAGADADAEAYADADSDAEPDAEAHADADTDSDSDSDAEAAAGADADPDAEADADADAEHVSGTLAAPQEAAELQRVEAERQWLAKPPPILLVPARFSEAWFADNVHTLHPGQIPELLDELHYRGWTDDKIAVRVEPYIRTNPYVVDPDPPIGRVG